MGRVFRDALLLLVIGLCSCATTRPAARPSGPTAQAQAQAPAAPQALVQPPPAPETTKPLLCWQVTRPGKNGGKAFLFGSIHVWRGGDPPIDGVVSESFAGSDALVVEVDTTEQTPVQMAMIMRRHGVQPQGQTLRDQLKPETFQALSDRLKRRGLPIEPLLSLKPWFISLLLSVQDLQSLGYAPENGLDLYFLKRAKGNKPIVSLETAEAQIALFERLEIGHEDEMVKDVLQGEDELKKGFEDLIAAWQDGDADRLDRNITRPYIEHPEQRPIYDGIFTERNRTMSERIDQLLKEPRTYFVVVGSGHMVGAEGIVSLLRRKGYVVEQLHRRP